MLNRLKQCVLKGADTVCSYFRILVTFTFLVPLHLPDSIDFGYVQIAAQCDSNPILLPLCDLHLFFSCQSE